MNGALKGEELITLVLLVAKSNLCISFKANGASTLCMCSKWVTNHILAWPCPSPSSFPPTSTNKFIRSFGGMRDGKRVCTSFEHKNESFVEVEILGANTFVYSSKGCKLVEIVSLLLDSPSLLPQISSFAKNDINNVSRVWFQKNLATPLISCLMFEGGKFLFFPSLHNPNNFWGG